MGSLTTVHPTLSCGVGAYYETTAAFLPRGDCILVAVGQELREREKSVRCHLSGGRFQSYTTGIKKAGRRKQGLSGAKSDVSKARPIVLVSGGPCQQPLCKAKSVNSQHANMQ